MTRIDDNDLRALRGVGRETPGETFAERKQYERRARYNSSADARRDRPVTPVLQVNFTIDPAVKARMVHACRMRDIKLYDFLRDAVTAALEKLEKE